MTTETKTSLFRAFDPSVNYGMFGYAGHCCDTAINRDDPEQVQECFERGWIDTKTRTILGTVMDKCDRVAPKCAQRLRELDGVAA